MKSIVVFAFALAAAAGLAENSAEENPGLPKVVPAPGQPASPEMKSINALNDAVLKALASQGPEAGAESISTALQKEVDKMDPKAIGMKPPVTDSDIERLSKNLAGIKELFERAEAAFKAGRYREAASAYSSVCLATAPGFEEHAAKARKRMLEMENLAKEHLNLARDKQSVDADFAGAAKELEYLMREFPGTAAGKQAGREMAILRGRPAAAAYLKLEQGRLFMQQGKWAAALQEFKAVAEHPRYHETVAAIEARRQMQELSSNPVLRQALEAEQTAKSENAARVLLAQARNLLKNNMQAKASAALKDILTQYPNTSSAEEAKKLLEIGK